MKTDDPFLHYSRHHGMLFKKLRELNIPVSDYTPIPAGERRKKPMKYVLQFLLQSINFNFFIKLIYTDC